MCLNCHSFKSKLNRQAKRDREVTDTPILGKKVTLVITHRRYICSECGASLWELLTGISEQARVTDRIKKYVQEQAIKRQFIDIAEEVGLSEETVATYFDELADRIKVNMFAPRTLGIDEVYIHGDPCAVFHDLDNHMMIDILDNNRKETVMTFIQSLEGHEHIAAVTMDMAKGYKNAVYETISKAVPIVDKFHVVKSANTYMMTHLHSIRNGLKTDKARDYLNSCRGLLKADKENITKKKDIVKLQTVMAMYPTIGDFYSMKELLRDFYKIEYGKEDKDIPENVRIGNKHLNTWRQLAHELSIDQTDQKHPNNHNRIKELEKLANQIERNQKEIVNWVRFPKDNLTNGFVEGFNNIPKRLLRIGNHFSFKTIRSKILLKQGVELLPETTKDIKKE